jgi:DNA-binding response OmpR family regulator
LILIVEDDEDLRDLEARILQRAEYRVETASDGAEALLKIAGEMPAVILLDMSMPGMDGKTFAAEFRTRHDHSAPIVVVTAALNAQKRAGEINADGYLPKPFSPEELLQTAKRFTNGTNGALRT